MQDAGSKPAIFSDELCMKFREQRFGLECIKDTYSPNRKERVNNQGYHRDDRCRNKKWDTLMENWNMLAGNMIYHTQEMTWPQLFKSWIALSSG